jgi:hypothetical protein
MVARRGRVRCNPSIVFLVGDGRRSTTLYRTKVNDV